MKQKRGNFVHKKLKIDFSEDAETENSPPTRNPFFFFFSFYYFFFFF